MKHLLIIIFIVFGVSAFAQDVDDKGYKVYLIGDAGEDTAPGKALLLLKSELLSNPNSAVVFLGDNVYPNGLKKGDKESELHLESQLVILQEYKGKVFFIPGNHDWDAQKRNGLQTLKDQEEYVQKFLSNTSTVENRNEKTFLPGNGLPGPETVMLNDKLRLIIIDTQWFLHFHKKNKIGTKKKTEELFYMKLDSILAIAEADGDQIIVTAHHPMYSNGQHSKSRQPFRFLVNCTPFQIFGLMGLNRLYSQDLSAPRYRKMRKKLLQEFNSHSGIIYASGHEHNLQCFKEKGNRYIVSGSGSKRSKLRKRQKYDSIFQDDKTTGFIKLEYSDGKYKSTTIYRGDENPLQLEGY